MKNMFREKKIKFGILLWLFLLLLVYTCFFPLKLEKESSLRLKKVSAIDHIRILSIGLELACNGG